MKSLKIKPHTRPYRLFNDKKGSFIVVNNRIIRISSDRMTDKDIIFKLIELFKKNKKPIKRHIKTQKEAPRLITTIPITDQDRKNHVTFTQGHTKDVLYMNEGEKLQQIADKLKQETEQELLRQGIKESDPEIQKTTELIREVKRGRPIKQVSDEFKAIDDRTTEYMTYENLNDLISKKNKIKDKRDLTLSIDILTNNLGFTPDQIDKNLIKKYKKLLKTDYGEYITEGNPDTYDPDTIQQMGETLHQFYDEEKGMSGNGRHPRLLYPEALWENQIKQIMKKRNGVYCPVIASDEINMIKMNSEKPTFFIMNLSARDDGSGGSHWVAVYIDTDDIDYFDSFGHPPTEQIKSDIFDLVNKDPTPTYRKFTWNKNREQDFKTHDCGWHTIRFLTMKLRGFPYKMAIYGGTRNHSEKGQKETDELQLKWQYV